MKVALLTSFPARFVNESILPELALRGVEVVRTLEPSHAGNVDFSKLAIDMVLHMTELGGHMAVENAKRAIERAGIPMRALSRKKASWNEFLPPPRLVAPPPPLPKKESSMSTKNGTAKLGDLPGAALLIGQVKDSIASADQPKEPTVINNQVVRNDMQPISDLAYAITALAEAMNGLSASIRDSGQKAVGAKPGKPAKEPKKDPAQTATAKVLELLGKFENLTSTELHVLATSGAGGEAIKIDRGQFFTVLSKMNAAGKIKRVGTGGKNSPYRYLLP